LAQTPGAVEVFEKLRVVQLIMLGRVLENIFETFLEEIAINSKVGKSYKAIKTSVTLCYSWSITRVSRVSLISLMFKLDF